MINMLLLFNTLKGLEIMHCILNVLDMETKSLAESFISVLEVLLVVGALTWFGHVELRLHVECDKLAIE